MRHILILMLLLTGSFAYANVPPWSKTGHRVIGEVASAYLKGKTRRALADLLEGRSLAAVSNYADEIKADPRYKTFDPWHYVNIPQGKDYSEVDASPHGDLIVGIETCIQALEDPGKSREERIFHLKMLIHLIGDLHQPMHIGREEDRGGNDIQLQWFGRGTNLHKIWDAEMIDDYGMSYSELSASLAIPDKKGRQELQRGTFYLWVEETQLQADRIYESVKSGDKLGYSYSYKYWDLVEEQLIKGGLRLAKLLNDVFS